MVVVRQEPNWHASPAASSSPLTVFAGGGGVLAAVALAALVRYRRRQFRHRLPGHSIAATPDELVDMERALLTAGSAAPRMRPGLIRPYGVWRSNWPATRRGGSGSDRGGLTDTRLQLVLDVARTDPPGAWTASADGARWTLRRADPTGYDPQQRGYVLAPFPALATVGHSTAGEHWLLDLERIGSLTMTGNHHRALALARFLAAELAHNSWAEMLQVTLVGFGAEMAAMHPDRLAYSADAAQALEVLATQRRSVTEGVDQAGVDVLQGRLRDGADAWAPHVLLIDPGGDDAAAVDDLVTAVNADTARSTVALVVTTAADDWRTTTAGRWQLRIDDAGVLLIPALDVELIAQQIPPNRPRRWRSCWPSPPTPPFPARSARRPWWTTPDRRSNRPGPGRDRCCRCRSRPTSTTRPPRRWICKPWRRWCREQVRAQVEAADDDLDVDLADWRDGTSTRAKVVLLGPVTVTPGRGNQTPTSSRTTEIVAYLTTRPNGVSIDQYATDLWPDEPDIIEFTKVKSKVRTSASQVRKLLGVNPRTGVDYLPRNAGALGAAYRLDSDLLIDAVLFRRLRVRGLARGTDGHRRSVGGAEPGLRGSVQSPPSRRVRVAGRGGSGPRVHRDDRGPRAHRGHPPSRRRRTRAGSGRRADRAARRQQRGHPAAGSGGGLPGPR